MSTFRGRPPRGGCLAGGIIGPTMAHCSSVRSEAYFFRDWFSCTMNAHSSIDEICANYLINLLFCQVIFPDSLSDPGGVLDTRQNVSRTAAFRRLQTVSFPLHTTLRDILVTTTIHISGLNDAACLLATPGSVRPLTGRHAGSLLTGWLGVSQVGFEPYWLAPTGKKQPIS